MNSQTVTVYDVIRPASRWMEIPFLITFNLLLVACAYVTILLPFSPVPITGQTFGVLLVAMVLGRVRGTAVVVAYVAEGLAGLPVFAGGSGGMHILFGPTGGYLIGFVAAAYLAGWLSEKGWDRSIFRSSVAMLIGYVIIFAFGLLALGRFVPTSALLMAGLWPFMPGMIAKICLACWMLPVARKFVSR